jgi:radical SAM protein with 4Fe4S-binding SPASM domain
MTEKQLITVFTQIRDFLIHEQKDADRYNVVDIHIIGGEPTMLGLPFFEATIPTINSLMDEVRASGIEVKFSIVTNLVTDDALAICRLFDVVATSYEVDTRFVSLKGRPLKALENQWVKNVNTLQSEGKPITVTSAVTRQAIDLGARGVLDMFYRNGFKSVHLGFFIPSGDGLVNISSVFPSFEETTSFMIEAANWYAERRLEDKDLYINPIESMIESIYHGTPMDDIICPIIPGSLDIDWDGETVTCIEAGGEVDAVSLGNIFTSSIIDVLEGQKYRREKMKAVRPQPHCVGCDELPSCQSACGVLHEFWDGDGECPGFKGFIKHIRKEVSSGNLKPKSVIFKEEKEGFRAC